MAIGIRNPALERQVRDEAKARGIKTLARTLTTLAEERLAELRVGQYLPPPPRHVRRASRVA